MLHTVCMRYHQRWWVGQVEADLLAVSDSTCRKLTVSDLYTNEPHFLNFLKTHIGRMNSCGNFCNGCRKVKIHTY